MNFSKGNIRKWIFSDILPESICNLKGLLDAIGLANNNITSIDEEILKICKMDLTGNPIIKSKTKN